MKKQYKVLEAVEIDGEEVKEGQIVELTSAEAKKLGDKVEVVETKEEVRVVGIYLGKDIDRVYSLEVNGENYKELAEEFAKKIGGKVE